MEKNNRSNISFRNDLEAVRLGASSRNFASFGTPQAETRRNFSIGLMAPFMPSRRDSVASLLRLRDDSIETIKRGKPCQKCAFPPGSVVKPLTLAALYRRKLLAADETFLCPGILQIAGRQLNCSHPPTALPMDATRALAYSCNAAIAHWSRRFRPGELVSELQTFGLAARDAETRLLALGEAGLEVTVHDLLRAYRRLMNVAQVRNGLEGAVNFGTAQKAAIAGVQVAGKTGSAQTSAGVRIAWFAGFAPSRQPEFVIAVLAAGASGGADAAPIARDLLAEAFHKP